MAFHPDDINNYQIQDIEANCLIRDQFALKKQLARIRKSSKNTVEKVEENTPDTREITRWLEHYHRSAGQVVARKNTVPDIRLNTSLPVAEKAQEIREMLLAHQVLVIAGETGSGKTTQLPQICLQAGRGMRGMIGHTQPRRLAATTVASRIAEEMRVIPGVQVGYQIRFHDRSDDEKTLIKLMTHGILLAEIQQDRFLNKYDTLIIDEAHERSLNIDFLLGYLKYLLPKRPELKVIVTSATIDLERFSRHFDNAPVIEVSGRSFPVEVFYRPSCEDDEADKSLQQQIVETVEHCLEMDARRVRPGQGDILVFLSGEREIRETAIALKKAKQYSSSLRDTEILPLYARLSSVEQSKVFRVQRGRRIVLATNVAETSLTVPGIRYVIDPGYARISRYNYKTQIQRLPIEAISQASANQRKGRCGRVQDGVCFRLYSEDDFLQRAPFTEPEILRTNLASVILQMNALGLGNIKQFPFVESPDSSLVRDGYKLLEELNAIDKKGALTKTGRLLVRLPVDPRYAAMLIHAAKTEALSELLIIVSALSIQDPRERPQEKQQVADQQHRQWRDEKSDFIAFLNLWNDFEQQRQVLSQNQLRKWCSKNFLSYMRMREWRDLHFQLKLACQHAGFRVNNTLASYEAVHTALCAGLLSHIAVRMKSDQKNLAKPSKKNLSEYLGARQKKLFIFPGSALVKKAPAWIVAAELVHTTKNFALTVAEIEPQWIIPLAGSLLKRSWTEPRWDRRGGRVVANEKVSLFGLPLIDKQVVGYGAINPAASRDIFIREALVNGHYDSDAAYKSHNDALLEELR